MRNKILAVLVVLKLSLLFLWLMTSINPFTPLIAVAGLPPRAEPPPEVRDNRPVRTSGGEKGLILAIRRKEDELRIREDELTERRGHLLEIKGDVEAKVIELKTLVKEMNGIKARIESFNNARTRRLVKIYENMAPQDAAARIERLDDNMAASILGSMREKIAGKILGFVNVDKSVKISRVLKKDFK